jgi:hypothetical protein
MKKNILFLSVISLIVSCSNESKDTSNIEKAFEELKSIKKDAIVEKNITINLSKDSIKQNNVIKDIVKPEQKLDSLSLKLISDAEIFLELLNNRNFNKIQKMLHPEGVYFFTIGKVSPKNFNEINLNKKKGILDGAYAYGENPTKNVSGMYFIENMDDYNYDSVNKNYFQVRNEYFNTGFGHTGNYSSPHMCGECDDLSGTLLYGENAFKSQNIKVVYRNYNDCDSCNENYLLIEFFKHKNEYKIFAVSNLEWTP